MTQRKAFQCIGSNTAGFYTPSPTDDQRQFRASKGSLYTNESKERLTYSHKMLVWKRATFQSARIPPHVHSSSSAHPMVVMKLVVNDSSENRRSRQLLPTPTQSWNLWKLSTQTCGTAVPGACSCFSGERYTQHLSYHNQPDQNILPTFSFLERSFKGSYPRLNVLAREKPHSAKSCLPRAIIERTVKKALLQTDKFLSSHAVYQFDRIQCHQYAMSMSAIQHVHSPFTSMCSLLNEAIG